MRSLTKIKAQLKVLVAVLLLWVRYISKVPNLSNVYNFLTVFSAEVPFFIKANHENIVKQCLNDTENCMYLYAQGLSFPLFS